MHVMPKQLDPELGGPPRVTIEENEEIRRLRAENRRLREDAILKAATTLFGELDPRNG
jgi:transposase